MSVLKDVRRLFKTPSHDLSSSPFPLHLASSTHKLRTVFSEKQVPALKHYLSWHQ